MMPPEEHIPSKAIVPYYLLAALCFFFVSATCFLTSVDFLGHYFQPKLLAITHLAVLGWATTIIFGASNQLVPVIAEKKLFSDKIPLYVFALLTVGTALLVYSFWNFSFTLSAYAGGGLIICGFLLHAFNLYKTAITGRNDIIKDFILTAHVWLIVTGTLGLLLLVNFRMSFLPADHLHYLKLHASIGMAGWFLQLIVGISSRLIPMFLLSRNEDTKLLNIAFYAINVGLILFLLEGMIWETTIGRGVYFLIVAGGLIPYALYIRKCIRTALKKNLDSGMKHTFLALLLISVPFVLAAIQVFSMKALSPAITVSYGFAFIFGFTSVLIMGQTFKTLPFIVWMHITKKNAIPELLPKDLYNDTRVKWQMVLYFPGFLFFLLGILLKTGWLLNTGGLIMTIAAGWYLVEVLLMINKLRTR